ncbi:MAG TPA: hypothetical protein VFB99_10790 [Vicinamibacterales bacterium]|nr:hypothetical protein [Vicinamibacterales bacterium]
MTKSDLVLATRPEASLVVTLSPNSVAAAMRHTCEWIRQQMTAPAERPRYLLV